MARQGSGKTSRRTGVVTGMGPRNARRSQGRASSGLDWVPVIALIVIGIVALAWLLSPREDFGTVASRPTSTPVATAFASLGSPTRSPRPSAEPTLQPAGTDEPTEPRTERPTAPPTEPLIEPPVATDEPAGPPIERPAAPPTQEPTAPPTVRSTVQLTAEPTVEPTAVPSTLAAFTIDSIADGETVHGSSIEISGAAPPGATVTRDVPLWLDDHATARAAGRWVMPLSLSPGDNELRFRLGDDRATERVIHIRSVP